MTTEGEVVNVGPLSSQVENSDLGVGDTTVVSGLWEPGPLGDVRKRVRNRHTACSYSIGNTLLDVDPS